jgi:hypothetical protein
VGLLGRDLFDDRVVIVNPLEQSDHVHAGQILMQRKLFPMTICVDHYKGTVQLARRDGLLGCQPKAVQRMLGHAKASMTLDGYADLFDEDLDSVAGHVGRRDQICWRTQWYRAHPQDRRSGGNTP